jgi:D-glycero-alpha-D-manno-heptose-7-phosphate kinase
VCVALIGALAEYYRIPYNSYEIAQLAYHIEREDLGIKGGYQDQYAAAFGGFNLMEFGKNGSVVVNPLRINQQVLNELHYHLVLIYTGKSRMSDNILDKQINRMVEDPHLVDPVYEQLKQYALDMKSAVITGNLDEFGLLLKRAWDLKKTIVDGVSTPWLEEIWECAEAHGAQGGRIMGAGGGGHMIFYVDYRRKREVIRALQELGVEVKNFQFEQNGLQTWIQK